MISQNLRYINKKSYLMFRIEINQYVQVFELLFFNLKLMIEVRVLAKIVIIRKLKNSHE
jgi:hypothetical protein